MDFESIKKSKRTQASKKPRVAQYILLGKDNNELKEKQAKMN